MSTPRRIKVLYFYTAESPFVEKDMEILSSKYELKKFRFNVYNKKKLFSILFQQKLFLLRNIFSSKLVVSQFAGVHSVLPVLFAKLFFKKSIIVSGGTDCVSFPSINYGNFLNKRTAMFTKFCFNNCSLIIPVHESLVYYKYTYQTNDFPAQGIKYFMPELKTKIITIYNGYDNEYWRNKAKEKVSGSFITVLGHLNSRFTIQLKGIDLFISLCEKFPDCSFTIVGGQEIKRETLPKNLQLLPNIWGEKLVDLFSEKQFYVQLSMSEGFPNALTEAMLCECVPIVSNVGGMTDIVSDCGYILKEKNENLLEDLVKKAILSSNTAELGKKARQRIQENYTYEKRQIKLLQSVEEILNSK